MHIFIKIIKNHTYNEEKKKLIKKLKCKDLDNRHLSTEHENHAHLEKKTEGVTNVVGVELLEALSAITTLKQKRLALSGLGQAVLQAPRLTSEDNGRKGLEGLEDKVQRVLIRVFGLLEGLLGFPTVDAPSGGNCFSCGGRRR